MKLFWTAKTSISLTTTFKMTSSSKIIHKRRILALWVMYKPENQLTSNHCILEEIRPFLTKNALMKNPKEQQHFFVKSSLVLQAKNMRERNLFWAPFCFDQWGNFSPVNACVRTYSLTQSAGTSPAEFYTTCTLFCNIKIELVWRSLPLCCELPLFTQQALRPSHKPHASMLPAQQ